MHLKGAISCISREMMTGFLQLHMAACHPAETPWDLITEYTRANECLLSLVGALAHNAFGEQEINHKCARVPSSCSLKGLLRDRLSILLHSHLPLSLTLVSIQICFLSFLFQIMINSQEFANNIWRGLYPVSPDRTSYIKLQCNIKTGKLALVHSPSQRDPLLTPKQKEALCPPYFYQLQ